MSNRKRQLVYVMGQTKGSQDTCVHLLRVEIDADKLRIVDAPIVSY